MFGASGPSYRLEALELRFQYVMAILDRFRTQPRQTHPDPSVRLGYVQELPIDDRDQLASIAQHDDDARVRRAAVAKLMDPAALASVARDDLDQGVRQRAMEMLRDIALEAFEGIGEQESLAAVNALADARTLAHVARSAVREPVAQGALSRVSDAHTIGSIARHAALEPIRVAALQALTDHDEVLSVALHSEYRDTALAALERVSDRAELEQVANRATNRSAAKRARALVREMDERAAAEAAAAQVVVPDPTEVARGERLGIIWRLDAAASGDLQAAEIALQQAEARWASLDVVAESALAERFAAAASLVRGRLKEAAAKASEHEREQAETIRRRAEQQAARRQQAQAAAEKEDARRRARLSELVEEAEAALGDADLASARRRLEMARREWRDLSAGTSVDPQVAARFAGAESRLAEREASTQDENARVRREGLTAMQQLVVRAEALLKQPDLTLKAADRALRDVRGALSDIPPLPSRRDYDEITRLLKAAQAALTPKVQELREAEEWKRFANLAVQEQLCVKMEALGAVDDPDEAARRVRELQHQWRQAADVPRAQGEAPWRRFKAAHDAVWGRLEAHFAAETEARATNLARKIELSERAERLADSTNWIQTAEEIKQLQAEWKTIGPVTRGQEKIIWERFRSSCDRFFTRRHQDLAERKSMWARNFALKDALCAKAEALADSTDWETAALEIKRLQAEWKTIGPVKRTRSEAIWQRFRGACDRFFTRYAQRHDIARDERVAAREAICAELEALAPTDGQPADAEPPSDCLSKVRAIRARWQQEIAARGVDRERGLTLEQRFQAAFERVAARWPAVFAGSDLDLVANVSRMEGLVARVEEVAASVARAGARPGAPGIDAALSPPTRLAAMLKEALAANTIGGRVDAESRLRAAQEEIRNAQTNWARIGPVPEARRRALHDRFQRACRRVADATGRGAPARRPPIGS